MKSFKYITNFLSGQKTVKLFIDDEIGEEGIRGAHFAREMRYLAEQGVESAIIDINSIGGSIIEGFSIFSSIQDAPFRTTTRVIGIAASMSGIVSQAGDHRVILDYGIFHAHGPQVPEGVDVSDSLVGKMLESLKTMIGSKANISEEKINEIMSKDSVFTAAEALEMGFFDEIEKTKGNSPVLKNTLNPKALYEIANKFINKTEDMDKINEVLKLKSATEDTIVNSIKGIQAKAEKVETLTNELATATEGSTAKDAEIETLKNEVKEAKALNAEVIVNAAIVDGKLTEESKATWLAQATNDFEGTKKMIEGLGGSKASKKIADKFQNEGEQKEERKAWNYAAWGKNDPVGLEKMQNSAPDEFKKLLDAYTA